MEKNFYPVFSVDVCFTSYAMEYKLIGAKDKEDLLENFDFKPWLTDYSGGTELQQQLDAIKNAEYRIKQIEGLYTDTPYKVLDSYAYY